MREPKLKTPKQQEKPATANKLLRTVLAALLLYLAARWWMILLDSVLRGKDRWAELLLFLAALQGLRYVVSLVLPRR